MAPACKAGVQLLVFLSGSGRHDPSNRPAPPLRLCASAGNLSSSSSSFFCLPFFCPPSFLCLLCFLWPTESLIAPEQLGTTVLHSVPFSCQKSSCPRLSCAFCAFCGQRNRLSRRNSDDWFRPTVASPRLPYSFPQAIRPTFFLRSSVFSGGNDRAFSDFERIVRVEWLTPSSRTELT